MKNYEKLENLFNTKFRNIFFFNELDKDNLKDIKEIIKIREDLNNVQWLYSGNDNFYLIGIQNNKVVTFTSEGDFEILTDDFAFLPFLFIDEISTGGSIEDYKNSCLINSDRNFERNELIEYAQWCKEQGINVPAEHLKWTE